MRLFYDENFTANDNILREEESYHCAKVLRLKEGNEIFITDGKGNLHKTSICYVDAKKTTVKVIKTYENYGKLPYDLHIAIAPTKNNDRTEWFVEKATEIGISEITPIICKNSERKIIKTDRLNKIAEAAMKQSYKAYHPQINEQIKFSDFIKNIKAEQTFVAHCEDDGERKYLANEIKKGSSVCILIGPEGDFSTEEIDSAKKAGFIPVTLGDSRLRTETAAVVACDIVSIVNQMKG